MSKKPISTEERLVRANRLKEDIEMQKREVLRMSGEAQELGFPATSSALLSSVMSALRMTANFLEGGLDMVKKQSGISPS